MVGLYMYLFLGETCDNTREFQRAHWSGKKAVGTSVFDWQQKKDSLCSGNWQQVFDPVQCSTSQQRMRKIEHLDRLTTAPTPSHSDP